MLLLLQSFLQEIDKSFLKDINHNKCIYINVFNRDMAQVVLYLDFSRAFDIVWCHSCTILMCVVVLLPANQSGWKYARQAYKCSMEYSENLANYTSASVLSDKIVDFFQGTVSANNMCFTNFNLFIFENCSKLLKVWSQLCGTVYRN